VTIEKRATWRALEAAFHQEIETSGFYIGLSQHSVWS